MAYEMPEQHSSYRPAVGETVIDTRGDAPYVAGEVLDVDGDLVTLVPPEGSPTGSGSVWWATTGDIVPSPKAA